MNIYVAVALILVIITIYNCVYMVIIMMFIMVFTCVIKALERPDWDEEPNEVEMDLWDASRLQCYEHLTQWNNLYKCTVTSIDDNQPPSLDKVWEDTYFQVDITRTHNILTLSVT